MTDIVTVPIHHPELDAESWVPAETADSWAAQGWLPGRLERLAEADEVAAAEAAEAARIAAAEWAAEHPQPRPPITGEEPDVALDEPAPVADTAPSDVDESVPTGDQPLNPEEG